MPLNPAAGGASPLRPRSQAETKKDDEMKILIAAPEFDNHTAPLKWALEQAGFSVACWAGLAWTKEKQACISLFSDTQLKLG